MNEYSFILRRYEREINFSDIESTEVWRRGQDSNLQALSRGSFQDYCLTN